MEAENVDGFAHAETHSERAFRVVSAAARAALNTGPAGRVLGLGHDVVGIDEFASQLSQPGSRMRQLFSPRELRQAASRAKVKHDGEAAHLAVRWAGKEAVLKAWCEALGERPNPYTLDDFPWSAVEILDDSRSRPHVVLAPACETRLRESLGVADDDNASSSINDDGAMTNATEASDGTDGTDGRGGTTVGAASVARPALSLQWHVSLTHDAGIASAVVLLASVER
ncbi:4'-phosphopantetheinyl transferase superfamily protein [Bifidobacterium sp. ESL0790]|uniref:holo-ACP synthase n=1 Tax=Bifidobacterium sp. ESL0790 TaxID=2983233 RepID=UPI0023F80EB5|nr:4'-phosphopantetheinyl transferase superfamily protein [Bifidobacterium sp. ESL0790]WEV72232.1 4'-phosphopantetheinyl transferase superfamily protein [Bifidobacterium sp. ESL0790]